MDGIQRLIAVMVHEQLHTDSDATDGHDHPPEFFEAFENVMTSPAMELFGIAAMAMRRYDEERQKVGLERSLKVAKALDQVEKAAGENEAEQEGGEEQEDDVRHRNGQRETAPRTDQVELGI